MLKEKTMFNMIRDHKTMLIIVGICLFLIELEIFAMAAMKSGRKSRLMVMDTSGSVIYETDGKNLSSFDKYYFEKTFGPFENFEVKMETEVVPFPFRAWFAGAIGIPVCLVLLFSFVIKVFVALFYRGKKLGDGDEDNGRITLDGDETRLEKLIMRVSRFNIFAIGFLVFCLVFSYWAIPNMITYVGRVGIDAVSQYKWVFICVAVILLFLLIFVIYLRYLLARKSIDAQTELEKYRMQLEYTQKGALPLKLDYMPNEHDESQKISWDVDKGDER